MENRPKVLMIITLDTKEVEARYLRKCLEDSGLEVYHLDASIRHAVDAGADITPDQIAAAAGKTMSEIRALNHEGKCLEIMIQGAIPCAHALDQRVGLSGIIGVGGSLGTALCTAVMRNVSVRLAQSDDFDDGIRQYQAVCGDQGYCFGPLRLRCPGFEYRDAARISEQCPGAGRHGAWIQALRSFGQTAGRDFHAERNRKMLPRNSQSRRAAGI